jgi:hypothetical protein
MGESPSPAAEETKNPLHGPNTDIDLIFEDLFPRTLKAIGLTVLGLDPNGTDVGAIERLQIPDAAILEVIAKLRNQLLKICPISLKMEIFGDVINDIQSAIGILTKAVLDGTLSDSQAAYICVSIHSDLFAEFLRFAEGQETEEKERLEEEARKNAARMVEAEQAAFRRGVAKGKKEERSRRRKKKG